MLKINIYLFLIILILPFKNLNALESEWSYGAESEVRLISPYTHNNNLNEIVLGLEYKLNNGWKTYWKSPGEGGFSQLINWESSTNISNLDILWPIPEYFEILGFISVGYTKEIIFPLKLKIKDINKKTSIVLDLNYLTCKDICIPGNANLELTIPPGYGSQTSNYFKIQKSLSLIPRKIIKNSSLLSIDTNAFEDKENISIILSASSNTIIKNPKFFLHTEFGLPVVKPKLQFSSKNKNIQAKFDFDKNNFTKKEFDLNITFQNDKNAFQFDTKVQVKKFSQIPLLNNSFIYVLIISLIGGIILNAMPCVFPVLSIKILSILKNINNEITIRKSFLITSLGIITSFTILALTLILLRFIGVNIVWGMQFQQPIFLIIIAIILLVFSLNLFGLFEFKVPQFVNNKSIQSLNNNSFTNDFFNGFFATILATPCTAPFVGTAITAAFTQSSFIMLGIFIFMGIGMSSPYLIISIFPKIIKFFPKPGKWMQSIKFFLGILLFGTFIWIISILFNHLNLLSSKLTQEDNDWLTLESINLNEITKNNSIVFVDITADWCATCQFNKINVINSKKIKEKFKKFDVIKIRGDWTKSNKKIEDYLKNFNKFGIPLNVIYTDNGKNFYILSELLTEKEIIEYINNN